MSIPAIQESVSNWTNPFNISDELGRLEADESRILTSAKRPLFLTWSNERRHADLYESKFQLIFKQGDDLRQDILTLQILRLIDAIWKRDSLDMK